MAVPLAGKIAIEVAKDPDKAIKFSFMVLGAFFGLILLFTLPFMLFFLPAAEPDDYDRYYEAAESINSATGLVIDWKEIIALDAVIKDQEFEDTKKSKIEKEYRKLFVIETTVSEQTSCGYFQPPGSKCYKNVTKYSKRSLEDVISMLGLTEDQIEQVNAMLESDLNEMLSEKYQSTLPIGGGVGGGGTAVVGDNVLRWKPLVVKYATENKIESYVPYILAQIQQESGGTLLDVMQCSESQGLPRNTISDPEYSIQIGVAYLADNLRAANYEIKLALQAYNFGIGFVDYALQRGGYSKDVAVSYSNMKAGGKGGYGDVNYVDNVLRYYTGGANFDFDSIYQQLREFEGWKYVWGGRKPSQGGFDCSGLLQYVLNNNGIKIWGTAADMYEQTSPVEESDAVPGDLVFFKTTEKWVSHVGMYIGNGMFYNSNDKGVMASSLDKWRKNKDYIFHGFRRIK